MYSSKISGLIMTTMAATVVADNCFTGYLYCSVNLLSQGDYASTINIALEAAGQQTDSDTINRALFACLNDGEIVYTQLCGGNCYNEAFGTKKNDHC